MVVEGANDPPLCPSPGSTPDNNDNNSNNNNIVIVVITKSITNPIASRPLSFFDTNAL